MRVASLLPGATEIASLAGAENELVGVTHECDYPPGVERLPKLTASRIRSESMSSAEIDAAVGELGSTMTDEGSIYELRTDLLEELAPDLILTQGLCDVCAVSINVVERAAAQLQSQPRLISLNPASISDVLEDVLTVGIALGREDAARKEVESLRRRLALVEERVSGLSRPKVGCLEWLDPPFSAGHWVPEMVRLAGGEDALASPGEASARLSWESFVEAAPEVMVLMPCGFDAQRTLSEAHALDAVEGWSGIPAVEDGRVWAVDANSYFSRPAPRLVDGVEMLARILHPEAFPDAPHERAAVRLSGAHAG